MAIIPAIEGLANPSILLRITYLPLALWQRQQDCLKRNRGGFLLQFFVYSSGSVCWIWHALKWRRPIAMFGHTIDTKIAHHAVQLSSDLGLALAPVWLHFRQPNNRVLRDVFGLAAVSTNDMHVPKPTGTSVGSELLQRSDYHWQTASKAHQRWHQSKHPKAYPPCKGT